MESSGQSKKSMNAAKPSSEDMAGSMAEAKA